METEYIRKICEHDIVTGMYYSCFLDNCKWGQSNLFKSLIPKIQIQVLQTDIYRFPLKDYLKEFDDRRKHFLFGEHVIFSLPSLFLDIESILFEEN